MEKISRVLVFLAALAFLSDAASEPYRFGNLVAQMPKGWTATEIQEPGFALVTFQETPDDDAASLFWLEITPASPTKSEALIKSITQILGVTRLQPRQEQTHPRSASLVADGILANKSVTLALFARQEHARQLLFGFIASPQQFKALNGRKLPLVTFNNGESLVNDAANPKHRVLAKAGSVALTEQMVVDTLAFVDFLAAQTISNADKLTLRQAIIEEFPNSSQKELQAYKDLGVIVPALDTMTPSRRAQLHRDMMAQIWFDAQKLEEPDPLMDLVYRYNPILGADEKLGLVAPRSALNALLSSNSFIGTQAGLTPITQQQRDAFAEQVRKEYATLTEKQKRYISDGELNWIKVIIAWRSWNPAQRKKHLGVVGINRVTSVAEVPGVARAFEDWSSIHVTSQQAMQLVKGSQDMMVLGHLRGLLGQQ